MVHTDIYSIISNLTGSISFFSSFISLFPQILETYHDKTVDGISPYFLLCWLCGDITSLVGGLMTHQLMFQIALAIYFLCNDLFVCGQYYYYGIIYKNQLATVGHETVPVLSRVGSLEDEIEAREHGDSNTSSRVGSINQALGVVLATASNVSHVSALYISSSSPYTPPTDINHGHYNSDVGITLSWMGAMFYVGARIPQLIKNYQRKSTDGLSPFLFATTLLGNITYNVSIFTSHSYLGNDDKWGFIVKTMPFIFGSAGTIVFDLIYFYQYYVLYAEDGKLRSLERELLREGSVTSFASEQTPLLTH